MKTRLVKHYFNMVEIALALAVLAIGMSSILVLFPVGINANNSAIADNNLADVGEYLMGYLRAGCAAEWAKMGPGEDPDFFFSKNIAKNFSDLRSDGKESINPLGDDYKDTEGNERRITSNLYQLKNGVNGVFLYKQMTTDDIVDFAAVVRVWQEETNFFAVNASSYSDGTLSEDTEDSGKFLKNDSFIKVTIQPGSSMERYARVLCIEISWPAQAPYDQREKRLFQQEFFNENFRWN